MLQSLFIWEYLVPGMLVISISVFILQSHVKPDLNMQHFWTGVAAFALIPILNLVGYIWATASLLELLFRKKAKASPETLPESEDRQAPYKVEPRP